MNKANKLIIAVILIDFIDLVQKIHSKVQNPPSLEEITAEVEQQRAEMYAAFAEENKNHH